MVKSILTQKVHSSYWTLFDIWNLHTVLGKHKFFKECWEKNPDLEIQWYYKEISYWFHDTGEKIITFGEMGFECFIILNGEVDIFLPKVHKLSLTDLELVKLKLMMKDFITKINW